MTKEEIEAMPAGREMDALIAERLFNCKIICRHDGSISEWGAGETRKFRDAQIPHYSTDIAAAWQVIERITRVPQSLDESHRAANTRFYYWWETEADLCFGLCTITPENRNVFVQAGFLHKKPFRDLFREILADS